MLAAALLMSALPAAADLPEGIEVRSHAGADGTEYQHLLVRPAEVKPGQKYPLVVFLHGAGERGSDPTVLAKHFFPAMLSEEYRERFPCYIIAPQCPKDGRWANRDWRDPENADGSMSAPMAAASDLVDAALEEFPIDTDRLYLTGLSMGGYGTWDWSVRKADFWAATAPICGGGNPDDAAALKDLPLWVVHGGADNVVPPRLSRDMVAATVAAGGAPIYIEYPDVGHDSWTPAYATPDGLIAWMFRQRKTR
ncbi:dienelactone hydrolase family protein [Alienimonas chondri]|nr:dienelactone hydrolase family protein [Alienimonas chondri]